MTLETKLQTALYTPMPSITHSFDVRPVGPGAFPAAPMRPVWEPPVYEPIVPIIEQRPYGDMSPVNSDVLGSTYGLDQGWKLGERFDFSEHGGSSPHVNYDLLNQRGKIDNDATGYLAHHHNIELWK